MKGRQPIDMEDIGKPHQFKLLFDLDWSLFDSDIVIKERGRTVLNLFLLGTMNLLAH